ncbi:MAG: hypothetical protein R3E08_13285 [Thiotrichaceae bacterium]
MLQSADILIYKAAKSRAGEDRVAHIEITCEVARWFNYLYEADLKKGGKRCHS